MRARSFLVLSAVTIVVTIAAGVATVRQERPQSAIESGGPVFPGLIDRLADVSTLVVRSAEGTLTIHRVDRGWALAERNDYPIQSEKVREVVRGLVQLEKAEAKTIRSERYTRLGVEDVGAPGAKSKEVTLMAAAGTRIAELIVGNPGTGVGAEGASFVRVPGDPQVWLAKGTVNVSVEPRDWVERNLIDIPAADIRQVRVVRPDRSTLTAVREASEATNFHLAELPKGGKLKRPDAADSLVQPFTDLPLDDLAPADTVIFAPDKTMRVTIARADGSTIAFDVTEREEARWLRFLEGAAPATLPPAGAKMAFRVPNWKITPLERSLSELVAPPGES
jgi:Domain of unknown function (DUF4340)